MYRLNKYACMHACACMHMHVTTRRPRKSDVWFDNDCRQMKKEIQRCTRRNKLGRPGANHEIWLTAQNNYRKKK